MYTEVTNRTAFFADAHLVSPFFRQAGKTCKFQFWYHMWGPHIGYLQVYYRRNSRDKQLFSIFGNQGNQWNKGIIDIPKCANDFQVSCYRPLKQNLVAILQFNAVPLTDLHLYFNNNTNSNNNNVKFSSAQTKYMTDFHLSVTR